MTLQIPQSCLSFSFSFFLFETMWPDPPDFSSNLSSLAAVIIEQDNIVVIFCLLLLLELLAKAKVTVKMYEYAI